MLQSMLGRGARAAFAAVVGAAALLASGPAAAQPVGCALYEHANFRGQRVVLEDGAQAPRFGRFWNDRVSSVRVADGCRLEVFEHWDYRGFSVAYDGAVGYVGPRMNDRFSAARCECGRRAGGGGGGGGAGGRGPLEVPGGLASPRGRAELPELRPNRLACATFSEAGYRGGWRAFERGPDDYPLGRVLRGSLSSVRVADGCFLELSYGRDWKILFERNVSNLPGVFRENAQAVRCGCRRGDRR